MADEVQGKRELLAGSSFGALLSNLMFINPAAKPFFFVNSFYCCGLRMSIAMAQMAKASTIPVSAMTCVPFCSKNSH